MSYSEDMNKWFDRFLLSDEDKAKFTKVRNGINTFLTEVEKVLPEDLNEADAKNIGVISRCLSRYILQSILGMEDRDRMMIFRMMQMDIQQRQRGPGGR